MQKLAKIISFIFHPVFIPFVVSIIIFYTCPQIFVDDVNKILPVKEIGLMKIQIVLNTILFPLLVSFLIWKLGFAKDMYMRTTQERLGPLMASILFYFWNFYALHKQSNAPHFLKMFLLSTFISISILFLATIFAKVSMHATAIVGATMALLLFALKTPCASYIPFIISFCLSLIVAWARLVNKDHTKAEIILGAVIGIISVVLASWIY